MPSGKTHDIISAFAAPVVIVSSYLILNDPISTLLISTSFIFSSFMFNGDLDMKSRPYYRWSLFRFIWIPYIHLFKHRSIFTHGLIIGTIIRLIYLLIIPTYILFHYDYGILEIISKNYSICVFVGLECGSALHTISDYSPKIFS